MSRSSVFSLTVTLVACGLFIAGLALSQPAIAWPLKFYPNGDGNAGYVRCAIPVTAVGSQVLSSAKAVIEGRRISINQGSSSLLSGIVIRAEYSQQASGLGIKGLVFFNDGSLLSDLDDATVDDLVFRSDGSVTGRITGIGVNGLSIRKATGEVVSMEMPNVYFIRSPKAFTFATNDDRASQPQGTNPFTAEVPALTFKATSSRRSYSMTSIVPHKDDDDDLDTVSKFPTQVDLKEPADESLLERRLMPHMLRGY
jgi:hypothetical protein